MGYDKATDQYGNMHRLRNLPASLYHTSKGNFDFDDKTGTKIQLTQPCNGCGIPGLYADFHKSKIGCTSPVGIAQRVYSIPYSGAFSSVMPGIGSTPLQTREMAGKEC